MSSHRPEQQSDIEKFLIGAEVDVVDSPRRRRKLYNLTKTLGGVSLVGAVMVTGGAVTAAVVYANEINSKLAFQVESTGEVIDAGVAEIVDVDMTMPPITLSTATTEVEGVKVAFEQKLTGLFDISMGENTVTRKAEVETLIRIDPGKVTISYDSEAGQLTFSALETALSTKVDIPTGRARTTDKTGSVAMLPAEWLVNASEAIDGTFGTDNSTVPIVREIAGGTLGIDEGLEKYADLFIVNQVDEQCTELIPEAIDNFHEQLIENIRSAVKGQLLDVDATNEVSTALMELPLADVQKLVEDAIITIPDDFVIGPDEGNIAELNDYKDSEFFTSTVDDTSEMVCGVSTDDTLTNVGESR